MANAHDDILSPDMLREEVKELFDPNRPLPGYPMFIHDSEEIFRLIEGELTIVQGRNGDGKTLFLNQLILHLSELGLRSFIASLEVVAKKTMRNICRIAACQPVLSHAHVDAVCDYYKDKIRLWKQTGKIDRKILFEKMTEMRKRGAMVFVIDNMTLCGISEDDHAAQAEFITTLADWTRDNQAITFLVVHTKKPADETAYLRPPSKYDGRGASAISDISANVLTVFRNRKKQTNLKQLMNALRQEFNPAEIENPNLIGEERRLMYDTMMKSVDEGNKKPDGMVLIQKNKEFGEEEDYPLFFDKDTFQFRTWNQGFKVYVPAPANEREQKPKPSRYTSSVDVMEQADKSWEPETQQAFDM
jgi:KaiC/GvpD/RAD55 family RecA-like ATPase